MVLVIGRHMRPPDGSFGLGLESFMRAWQRGGWVGVDLFFVLSGFLASGLLFREYQQIGRVRIGRFLARRGLKIYPAFYALLLVGVLVERLAVSSGLVGTAMAALIELPVLRLRDRLLPR